MNAPQHFEAVLEQLPISCIRPSPFKAQSIRRQHFSIPKMIELAASISANGVLQPILVRPMPISGTIKYEIVAGERRWVAADRAGLAHIPATVRDMTDAQILEAQLVENIQREGLHVLEEAEGYAELMKVGDLTAEQIGDKIGKSRSYVYARLKLLDLIPAARDALNSGELDASKALILARIKGEKMQTRALKIITEQGAYYSYRRLMETLRQDTMIPIAQAPWLDRDTLHLPKGGEPCQQCDTCPTRSINDPELAKEINDADVCLDKACFELKTKLHYARLRREYEAEGRQVVSGEAADAILDQRAGYMGCDVKGGYVRLDAICRSIEFPDPRPEQSKDESDEEFAERLSAWDIAAEDWTPPTFGSLFPLPDDAKLVQTKSGKLIPVAPVATVAKALKAKEIKVPFELRPSRREEDASPADTEADRARMHAEQEKERQRAAVELEFRTRLLKAIHAKWKPPLKKQDLESIADAMLEGTENSDAYDAIYGQGRPDIAKMKEPDLQRWMVIYAINHECEVWNVERGQKASQLLAYAQRLKIDVKKLRAEVVKDLKPVSAAPEAETPTKKKAVKK
jgi:ParB/RepB/Spo0J family partition protein